MSFWTTRGRRITASARLSVSHEAYLEVAYSLRHPMDRHPGKLFRAFLLSI